MVNRAILKGPYHILFVSQATQHNHRHLAGEAFEGFPTTLVISTHFEQHQVGPEVGEELFAMTQVTTLLNRETRLAELGTYPRQEGHIVVYN